MKLSCTLLLCLLLTSSVSAEDSSVDGTLYWGNGDSLEGRLISAKGDTLTWQSPLFADPLSLDLSVLSAMRFPELGRDTPAPPDDGFRITLVNNNVLSGKLVDIGEKTITFRSQRHGRLVLQKDGIRNLERHRNHGLVFLGPRGLDGWTLNEASSWKEQDDGSLTTLAGEASLSRPLELPPRCEVEFVLTSTSIPDFVLTIGTSDVSRPRLEMWGDSFVARSEKDFVELQVVPETLREMHAFALIDFEKSVMAVYSHTGTKLGELSAQNWDHRNSKFSLEAIDSDLTLKHLRISEWDGSIPQPVIKDRSRVHMQNGDLHYGRLAGLSDDAMTLRLELPSGEQPGVRLKSDEKTTDGKDEADSTDEENAATEPDAADEDKADGDAAENAVQEVDEDSPTIMELPLDEVTHVVLSTREDKADTKAKTIVAWRDGAFISGQLMSMDDTSITLATDFGIDPVQSTLNGVRRIGLPNTDVPQEEPDCLYFDGGSLRGNLTVEDNDVPIRWTPVGGKNATTLVSGGKARFQRGAEPEEITIDSKRFPDVVYLHDGDVLPCRTESCNEKHLQIISPVSEVRQLDVSLIKAMEFGNSHRERQRGFNKEEWSRVSGSVSHHDSSISFTTSGSYGHDKVMSGDALSFRIKWKASCYGNITFHLFAEKLSKPVASTTVNLLLQPSQIVVSDRAPNADGRMRFFGGNANMGRDGAVTVKKRDVAVEMLARDGKIHVSIDGKEVKVLELNSDGAGAKGLLISAILTSVNSRNTQTLKNDVRGLVEIDEFLVRNVVGASVKQFIQEEARERALTVPRFRRDDPPTHVLLAPNGDLLRGRLSAVTADEIVFESRLETFRFPRERVAAVIWLAQEGDAASRPVRDASAVQAKMDNGFMLTMTPQRMSNGQLIGTSRQLGNCQIPAKAIRDLFLGSPEGREDILSYVRWIRRDAAEPEWELPTEDGESAAGEMVGQVVEDFELPTLNGQIFRLSDHADKVVVLDFWATWCGPCVAALPEYVDATSNFDPKEAIFVAVNLEEPPERIKEFLSRHNLTPEVALDRGSVIARRFQVSGIPHSVVLGPGNVIKHVTVGYRPGVGAKTRERIENILAGGEDE